MSVRNEACCQHQKSTTLLLDKEGEKAPYSMMGKSGGFHHNPDVAGNRTESY
jgi:hypothetical protein